MRNGKNLLFIATARLPQPSRQLPCSIHPKLRPGDRSDGSRLPSVVALRNCQDNHPLLRGA